MSNIKFVCLDGATEIFKVDSTGSITSTLNISTSGVIQSTSTSGSTSFATPANITNTTISSNSSTGALTVSGGISINASANSSSVTQGGALTVRGGMALGGDLYIGGSLIGGGGGGGSTFSQIILTSTANSTSSSSGALQSIGGIGVGGNSFFRGNITIDGTVDSRDISTDGSNLDTLYTTIGLSALTSAEVDQLENINSTVISTTQWGYLGALNQSVSTGSGVTFGNISTPGTVDGRDVSVDGASLDNLTTTIGLSALTSAEVDQLENINSTVISTTQWGYLGAMNQSVATGSDVTLNSVIIDSTSIESLLVRRDADGGDVFSVDTTNNNVLVSSTVVSTSNTTGSLQVRGGVGITESLYAQNVVNGGFDFVLGSANQVTRGNSGLSRALVKNVDTALYINYFNDFVNGTVVDSTLDVDSTSVNAFVVRKNNDGGDTFRVDTTNNIVTINNTLDFVDSGSPLINMKSAGGGDPSFTTRSTGTKLVLYESLSASGVDYALGIGAESMWYSVESQTGGRFEWFAGTTEMMELRGSGVLSVRGTEEATNLNTGGLRVAGGVGIQKNVHIGGNTFITGNLTVSGTQTIVSSESLSINDNLIVVNSGPTATRDAGIIASRYQTENDIASGDLVTDTPSFTDTLPAQTGATSTTIILSSGASAIDDFYNNTYILVTSGAGVNQIRLITDYTGSSRTAVINMAWTTQPFIGNTVSIFNRLSVATFYDASTSKYNVAYTNSNSSSATIEITGQVDTIVGGLTTEDIVIIDTTSVEALLVRKNNDGGDIFTVDTTNSIIRGFGDTRLTSTTESNSITTGALTTTGGVGIVKNLNVGGNIVVTGTVDGRDVSVDGSSLDNLTTTIGLSALTSAEVDQLENINSTVISTTQWGYLGAMNQSVSTSSGVTFGNISTPGTVDGRDISVDGASLDNLTTTIGLSALTSGEVDQLENINSTVISTTQWGYLGAMDQSVAKGTNVTFGNISTPGTVDGRDVSVDGSSLDNLTTTIGLSALTSAEVDQLENINSTVISTTQWGYLGAMNQSVSTVSNVVFTGVTSGALNCTGILNVSLFNSTGIQSLSYTNKKLLDVGTGVTVGGHVFTSQDATLLYTPGNGTGSTSGVLLAFNTETSINLSKQNIIESTNTEALLVRKNNDGGDVFTVDTTNSIIRGFGDVRLTSTTESNSITTGALTTSGGVGIVKNLHIGGNIIISGTVDGRDISADGVTLDVLNTNGVSALTSAEVDQLENINTTVISTTQWGYLGAMNQSVSTSSGVTFGNISTPGTVDGRDISVDGASLDNLTTTIGLSALTSAEVDQLENINSTVISTTQWGYLGAMDQSVAKGTNVTFGNIIVTGTVDGRDISVDGASLDNLTTTIGLSALTSAEVDQLENINSTVISTTQWGYLGAMNQSVSTSSGVTFGNISTPGTVDGRDISTDGASLDNLTTTIGLSALTSGEVDQLENINSTVISTTQWGYLGAMNQSVSTSSGVTFGNISTPGTVDGRDISVDGASLDNLTTTIGLSALTSAEVDQLENINSTVISTTQWGYLGAMNQSVATGSDVTLNSAILDSTSVTALLVRRDGNTGDVFSVNTTNNHVLVSSTVVSTSNTTGSLQVRGGVGVTESLYAQNIVNGGFDFVLGSANQVTRGNSGLSRALVKNIDTALYINYFNDFFNGTVVDSTLDVDVTSTNAFVVRKNLDGGDVFTVDTTNSIIRGFGDLRLTSTVESTSITTGALTTTGGVGIAKNVHVGGNIVVTGTVDGRDVSTDGSSLDNLTTTIGLSALTSGEVDQLENINSTVISTTQWGYLGAMNQSVSTSSNVVFTGVTCTNESITSNLTVGAVLNTSYTAVVSKEFTGNTGAQLLLVNSGNDGSGVDRDARAIIHSKSNGESDLIFRSTKDSTEKDIILQSEHDVFRIIGSGSSTVLQVHSNDSLTLGGSTTTTKDVLIDGTLDINGITTLSHSAVSLSPSTGAIILTGGLGIIATANATSCTSGGALTVAGGVSIMGDVCIGGNLTVDGNSTTINISEAVGSHTGTGVKTVTVSIGQTLLNTNYVVVVTPMTTTDNTNVYTAMVVAKTTTNFKVNLFRIDALGAGWTDANLRIGVLIAP